VPYLDDWTVIPTDINAGGSKPGDRVYIAYKRAVGAAPVTDIRVLDSDHVPPGYEKLPDNLNSNGGGAKLHLALQRDRAITEVKVVTAYQPPAGYVATYKDFGSHDSLFIAGRLSPSSLPAPGYSKFVMRFGGIGDAGGAASRGSAASGVAGVSAGAVGTTTAAKARGPGPQAAAAAPLPR